MTTDPSGVRFNQPEGRHHNLLDTKTFFEKTQVQDLQNSAALPQHIGHFRIEYELGRGGMGIVYVAWDTILRRHVALKVMQPDIAAKPQYRDRFIDEGLAMARMNLSPYIMPVFAVGEHCGQPFLVMPLLNGESLDQRLRRVPCLTCTQAVKIVRHTLHGLAIAHAVKLIHRDVKPGNIFLEVEPSGRARWVKLMDFGLAIPMEDVAVSATRRAGTPMWMSPEQQQGQPLTDRTDVFSAGVVLFMLLTGRHPFESPAKVVTAPHPSVLSINNDVPVGVSTMVDAMLSKHPLDRPSADDAAMALTPHG